MYRELEEKLQAGQGGPDAREPGAEAICDCQCAEPVPEGAAEAPAGNKSAVNLRLHYEING